ncbi:hypothetical protein ACFOWZ_38905 [Lentzea rhizosphaerae]|uniref:Uncharacterized protein n=1 Tax=Lentzea rhizosphaerae TaxID=2041025 RepID=A0ABV8C637_9PSEU
MPRFTRFSLDGVERLSAVDGYHWTDPSVTLVRVDAKGVVRQAKSLAEKRAMLVVASENDLVLAGGHDVVAVDDLVAARAVLAGWRR